MPLTFLPFENWTPGGSRLGENLSEARNTLPIWGSRYPIYQANTQATTAAGPVLGAYAHRYPANAGSSPYTGDLATAIAGRKTQLYEGNFSSVGTGYAGAGEPSAWRFASFGNDVWATNFIDPIQRRTNNAGNFASGATSTFIPYARYLAVVREFMIAACLGNGRFTDEFAWSDVDDPTWWDDSSGARDTSLAGAKRLRSRPGQITGVVGGEYAVIYKGQSTHVLQYIGGSDLWRLDEVSRSIGVTLPGSLVVGKEANYFWGGDGFYAQTGMAPPGKISPPDLDELFVNSYRYGTRSILEDVDTMWREDLCMIGVQSRSTNVVFWFYKNQAISANGATFGIGYNPATGAWTEISLGVALTALIDASPITLSSPDTDFLGLTGYTWDGTNSRKVNFAGNTLAATLKTKRRPLAVDSGGIPMLVRVNGALPASKYAESLGVGGLIGDRRPAATVTVNASNSPWFEVQSDGVSTVSPRSDSYTQASANDYGWYPVVLEGCFFDAAVAFPANEEWGAAEGVWIDWEPVE